MFDAQALSGFVKTLTVVTRNLTDGQAKEAMALTAIAQRDRVIAESRARSGITPTYRQVVDGNLGAAFDTVRPDGVILLAWQYLAEIAQDTHGALVNRSPHTTGRYIAGLITMVDGIMAALSTINVETQRVQIVASVPYARRLEVGKRKGGGPFVLQVPPHIVEETATVARKLYGSLASITYGYVDLTEPYILINPRGHRRVRGQTIKHVRYPAITIEPRTA